jgi:hypothetical protein
MHTIQETDCDGTLAPVGQAIAYSAMHWVRRRRRRTPLLKGTQKY